MRPKGAVGGGAKTEEHGVKAGDKRDCAVEPERRNIATDQSDEIGEPAPKGDDPAPPGEHRRERPIELGGINARLQRNYRKDQQAGETGAGQ